MYTAGVPKEKHSKPFKFTIIGQYKNPEILFLDPPPHFLRLTVVWITAVMHSSMRIFYCVINLNIL